MAEAWGIRTSFASWMSETLEVTSCCPFLQKPTAVVPSTNTMYPKAAATNTASMSAERLGKAGCVYPASP